jgi:peptide chain release factor subunit 1
MKANDITPQRLRALSGVRPSSGKVLTLYLNLDPAEFGTGRARDTAVTSLLDEAHRRVEEEAGLSHQEKVDLRADVERAREALSLGNLPTAGAEGVALFASKPADLLEVLRLPRPIDFGVFVEETPHVEELYAVGTPEPWCVALVHRGGARFFLGSPVGLAEVKLLHEHQDRWERTTESEVDRHLRRTIHALAEAAREGRYRHLLIATPHMMSNAIVELVPNDVRPLLAGTIEVEEHATPDQVLEAAQEPMAQVAAERERAVLERFEQSLAMHGRAAAGLDDTLEALTERRVEHLIVRDGMRVPGVRCPTCGWLGTTGSGCPADGTPLEALEDLPDAAMSRAIEQDAGVLLVPGGTPVDAHGGIGAVLRF